MTERIVYRMFYLGHNFVPNLISTLKSKNHLHNFHLLGSVSFRRISIRRISIRRISIRRILILTLSLSPNPNPNPNPNHIPKTLTELKFGELKFGEMKFGEMKGQPGQTSWHALM